MKLISIIFSFRNEEKNLTELVNRVSKVFTNIDNWNYELIFVNDSSTDNSEKLLTDLLSKYPITLINMSRRFGVSACVLAGFKNAKGDAIIYMDSDLQDPPELIKDLIDKHEKGADIVHTVRTKRLGESKIKLLVTNLAYRVINFFSDIPLPINAGDYKLISRRALNKILELKEFRPYIRGLSVWVGYKQDFVEYVRDARGHGKSQFSILFSSGPVNEFLTGLTAYSIKPLYVGIVLGFLAILVSIFLTIYTFYAKFNNITVLGSAGIIISISFFSGVILLSQGIIGLYIARIFEQVRGRSRYIIDSIKKSEK